MNFHKDELLTDTLISVINFDPETDVLPEFPCIDSAAPYETPKFYQILFDDYKSFNIVRIRLYIAKKGEKTVGIVPLWQYDGNSEFEFWEFAGSVFSCNYRPPCPPAVFRSILPYLPAICDINVDYTYFEDADLVCQEYAGKSNVFELPNSIDDYYAILPRRQCAKYKAVLAKNSDLRVESDYKVREDISNILSPYVEYWKEKEKTEKSVYSSSFKVELDLKLFKAFPENTQALYFYQEDKLIAANFAWIDGNKVIDMLAVREFSEETLNRKIGIFAILKNIELSIYNKSNYYSLTTSVPDESGTEYKRRFYSECLTYKTCKIGSIVDLLFEKTNFYYKGIIVNESNAKNLLESNLDEAYQAVEAHPELPLKNPAFFKRKPKTELQLIEDAIGYSIWDLPQYRKDFLSYIPTLLSELSSNCIVYDFIAYKTSKILIDECQNFFLGNLLMAITLPISSKEFINFIKETYQTSYRIKLNSAFSFPDVPISERISCPELQVIDYKLVDLSLNLKESLTARQRYDLKRALYGKELFLEKVSSLESLHEWAIEKLIDRFEREDLDFARAQFLAASKLLKLYPTEYSGFLLRVNNSLAAIAVLEKTEHAQYIGGYSYVFDKNIKGIGVSLCYTLAEYLANKGKIRYFNPGLAMNRGDTINPSNVYKQVICNAKAYAYTTSLGLP